jgi:hypothetical protein
MLQAEKMQKIKNLFYQFQKIVIAKNGMLFILDFMFYHQK